MKTLIPLTALAALLASGSLPAQTPAYSKPSGYVTQTLVKGFNPVGLTLQLPAITSGTITSLSATSISDASKNFTSSLVIGTYYTLEITSGSETVNGLVTEVPAWTNSTLTTSDDLSAAGISPGSTYVLRKAATLQEVFGTSGSVLAKNNAINNADIVWVPDNNGGYTRYHQRSDGTWRNANTGVFPANDTPLIYLDGVFVQRKSSDVVTVTFTGSVKTTPTISSISAGFNFYATIYPVGATLQNLGLDNDLAKNNAIGNADVVWIPNNAGGFARYHMRSDGTWRNADTGSFPAPTINITSAIFIQRRGEPTALSLTPPSSYSNL